MNHISTPTIAHATEEDLSHLETCQRCRSRVTTDVDLGSVRARILSEATTEPRSLDASARERKRPWMVGVSAAALVLALFVPFLFASGGERTPSPASSSDPVDAVPTIPEDRTVLATGDNWTISIWEDGSEICHRTDVDEPHEGVAGTGGQGCQEPSTFSIPHILNLEMATAYDSGDLVYAQMLGIVTQGADRLVVTFESGDTIDLDPGSETRIGYRGFGSTDFDVSRLGEPRDCGSLQWSDQSRRLLA